MANRKVRHILGLSGGKDSAALALYLRDKVPEMEYFFCDTKKELPETYEFLYKLEARLGKKIEYLGRKKGFDYWLDVNGGFLPSVHNRWCTPELKLHPMEEFVGDDFAYSYIAIRADENRSGYIPTKLNIRPVFPFHDEEPGITKADVIRILEDSGVGMPDYYSWRSRSGCYFCFFQRKIEWVRLSERHPDLFEAASRYEREHEDGRKYFWNSGESLEELLARKDKIIKEHERRMRFAKKTPGNQTLMDILFPHPTPDEDEDDGFCFACNL